MHPFLHDGTALEAAFLLQSAGSGSSSLDKRITPQGFRTIEDEIITASRGHLTNLDLRDNGSGDSPYFRFEQELPGFDRFADAFVVQKGSVVTLAFMAADQTRDFADAILDHPAQYNMFTPLIQAVKNYLADSGATELHVIGHSLGGAITEAFMRVDGPSVTVPIKGIVFGSPGTNIVPGPIVGELLNIRHVEDPVTSGINPSFVRGGIDFAMDVPGTTFTTGIPDHSLSLYAQNVQVVAESPLSASVPIGEIPVVGGNFGETLQTASPGQSGLIYGGGGSDTIAGRDGNDRFDGGKGNDRLFGDGGNDLLIGGKDSDTLDGGTGDDTYVWVQKATDTIKGVGAGNDTLRVIQSAEISTLDVLDFRLDDDQIFIGVENRTDLGGIRITASEDGQSQIETVQLVDANLNVLASMPFPDLASELLSPVVPQVQATPGQVFDLEDLWHMDGEADWIYLWDAKGEVLSGQFTTSAVFFTSADGGMNWMSHAGGALPAGQTVALDGDDFDEVAFTAGQPTGGAESLSLAAAFGTEVTDWSTLQILTPELAIG